MRIGVVGHLGVVGSACAYTLAKLGYDVVGHDKRGGEPLASLLDCSTIYVCVPTKANPDGSCDTSIVSEVVAELVRLRFSGYIVIKSTVSPGFTQTLIDLYGQNVAVSPETLRERSSFHDYQNQSVCVIGTENPALFEAISQQHERCARHIVQLSPTQGELFKYMSNCYNATLITLANSFASVAESLGVEYAPVKDALIKRGDVGPNYLDSNPMFRGFSGPCLPKDCAEMANFCSRNRLGVGFFADLIKENARYPATVPPGMRAS